MVEALKFFIDLLNTNPGSLLVVLAGLAWWKANRIEERLDRLTGIGERTQIGVFDILTFLAETHPEKAGRLMGIAVRVASEKPGSLLAAAGNPLTHEEGRKIDQFVDKIRRDERLTPDEAYEFRRLTMKAESEPGLNKDQREALGAILVISALALGLYAIVGGKK